MKTMWETPVTRVEQFVANECIAVCWSLACSVDTKDDGVNASDAIPQYENVWVNGQWVTQESNTHSFHACGNSNSQHISDNHGTVTVREWSVAQNTWLDCTLTDSNWNPVTSDFTMVNKGDTVYWTTQHATDGRIWHHWGIAGANPDAPNQHS